MALEERPGVMFTRAGGSFRGDPRAWRKRGEVPVQVRYEEAQGSVVGGGQLPEELADL